MTLEGLSDGKKREKLEVNTNSHFHSFIQRTGWPPRHVRPFPLFAPSFPSLPALALVLFTCTLSPATPLSILSVILFISHSHTHYPLVSLLFFVILFCPRPSILAYISSLSYPHPRPSSHWSTQDLHFPFLFLCIFPP